MPDINIPASPDSEGKEIEASSRSVMPRGPPMGRPRPEDLARMNAEREEKIKRFKDKKELETRLSELNKILEKEGEDRVDDEIQREFYLKTVTTFAYTALEELTSFAQERPILEHLAKMRAGQIREPKPEKKRPLQPIIITRDAIQKEVFGLGYKNVPIYSIEEFYEQRVRDGWFPDAKQRAKSLQDQANIDQKAQEEEEEREKEDKEERDDEEELARKRAMDEYKDEHRRGDGNRHNKG